VYDGDEIFAIFCCITSYLQIELYLAEPSMVVELDEKHGQVVGVFSIKT
jgi:hypothetical protein